MKFGFANVDGAVSAGWASVPNTAKLSRTWFGLGSGSELGLGLGLGLGLDLGLGLGLEQCWATSPRPVHARR